MNKKCIIFILLGAILVGIVTYLNYDNIQDYFYNKKWELADSIATIINDDIIELKSGKKLIALTNGAIQFYKDSSSKESEIKINTSEIITNTLNEYTIVADKLYGNIYVLKDDIKIWESKISGTILKVSINKNGYAVLTYAQSRL